MPTFPDLREFYDPALVLPVAGVEYRIEAPSAREGSKLRRLMLDPESASSKTDLDYQQTVFSLIGGSYDATEEAFVGADGSIFAQLEADGQKWPTILRVAETAALHYTHGESQALAFWSRELLNSVTADVAKVADVKPVKAAPKRKRR